MRSPHRQNQGRVGVENLSGYRATAGNDFVAASNHSNTWPSLDRQFTNTLGRGSSYERCINDATAASQQRSGQHIATGWANKTAYLYSGQLYVIAGVNKSGRVCLFNRNDRDYIFRDFSPGHNRNRSVMAIAIYSVVVYFVGISTGRYIRAH